jgi:hypothetical protein
MSQASDHGTIDEIPVGFVAFSPNHRKLMKAAAKARCLKGRQAANSFAQA